MDLKKVAVWMTLLGLLCCSSMTGSADSKPLSLTETLSLLQTPEALVSFMRKEFKHIEDEELLGVVDYWQSPEEFWERRAGDCEDFALFAQFVLEKLGYETQVVSVYGPEGYAHTIAFFWKDGRYYLINEDRMSDHRVSSLEAVLSQVFPAWTWASRAEQRNHRGWSLGVFSNPSPAELPLSNPFADFSF